MKILVLTFILVAGMYCDDNLDNLVNVPGDMTNDPNNPDVPGDMTDRIDGMIFYAASAPCKAGEYSYFPNGVKTIEIECYPNGKRKREKDFTSANGKDLYLSGDTKYRENGYFESSIYYNIRAGSNILYKSSETIYNDNGISIQSISYHENGNKSFETIYNDNGIEIQNIFYSENGNKSSETIYREDGTLRKNIRYDSNGMITNTNYYMLDGSSCPDPAIKCVSSDP